MPIGFCRLALQETPIYALSSDVFPNHIQRVHSVARDVSFDPVMNQLRLDFGWSPLLPCQNLRLKLGKAHIIEPPTSGILVEDFVDQICRTFLFEELPTQFLSRIVSPSQKHRGRSIDIVLRKIHFAPFYEYRYAPRSFRLLARDWDVNDTPKTTIGKPAIFVASTFLVIPAFIPFYFAIGEQDPATFWLLIGVGISVLVANVLALILIYRWIVRYSHE